MGQAIDLNCDMGEGFGVYRIGDDRAIMPWISSANVACGFHAGDPSIIDQTVRLAKEYGVGIGAHMSFPDLTGFGRREMNIPPRELTDLILYQIGALDIFCRRHGLTLQHLKAHGSLNNMADRDEEVARAIAEACRVVPEVPLLVKPHSLMERVAREMGVRTIMEVYADRAYHADGTLVSRKHPNAVIRDPQECARRMLSLLQTGTIESVEGTALRLPAESICVHGDTPEAVEIARALHQLLQQEGYQIRPVGQWKRWGD